MGNAVLYARVSSDKQEADGDSLAVQEADCRADCAEYGDTVVGVYSDVFTGHDSLEERPGMSQAIKAIQRGDADTLVIKRISRSARDIVDNLLIHRDVYEAGGTFRSATEGVIPNNPMGKVMLTLHAFQAEQDWVNIREQTQQGRRSRVARGRPLASVPLYGYRYLDGPKDEKYYIKALLVPDDETAPVVREIYSKADQGWTVRRIAHWLDEQGKPTPSQVLAARGQLGDRQLATAWSPQMVVEILSKTSYMGRHASYGTKTTTRKVRGEDGTVKTEVRRRKRTDGVVTMDIPALVSAEQWQRVRQALTTRALDATSDAPTLDEPLLNKGLAVCGLCGNRMVAGRHSRGYRLYVCGHRSNNRPGHPCPGGAYAVNVADVDQEVWRQAWDIVRDDKRYERLVQSKSAKLAAQQEEATRRAAATVRELAETKAQQATVYARMTAETDETIYAMHRANLQHLNDIVAGLEARVKEAQATVTTAQDAQDAHTRLRELVASEMQALRTDSELQEMLQAEMVARGASADAAKHFPAIVDALMAATEYGEAVFSREAKRSILKALDAKVLMYPAQSDYAKANGKRWEFTFGELSTASMC